MTELRLYVIDTGCLLEFFKIDNRFSEDTSKRVKAKFKEAIEAGNTMYVPQPVLFECANHIAGIKNNANKKNIAERFVQSVQSSISDSNPWVITHPTHDDSIGNLITALNAALEKFNDDIQTNAFSLVDIVVINEAKRLQAAHPSNSLKKYLVHIWTTEHAVKAHEPDTELNAFI